MSKLKISCLREAYHKEVDGKVHAVAELSFGLLQVEELDDFDDV